MKNLSFKKKVLIALGVGFWPALGALRWIRWFRVEATVRFRR